MIKVYLGNITGGSVTTTPLSCGLLRCHAEQNDLIRQEVEWGNFLYHTRNGVNYLVSTQIKEPDVLALSCYAWNLNRNLKIAKKVKKKYPKCLVVFGGPEIPEDPYQVHNFDEYYDKLDPVDLLVVSEGELPFEEILLNVISNNRDWTNIPNVHYKKDGHFTFKQKDLTFHLKTPIRKRSPWLSGYFDFMVDELAVIGRKIVAVMETNRGCPNKCTFCVSGSDNRGVQAAKLKQIIREIDYIGKISNEVIISDANFGILKQDEAIAEALAETSKKYGVLTKTFVSWSKGYSKRIERIAKILSKADLITAGVTVSLQTTTPKVLHAVRRKNLDLNSYSAAIKDFRDMEVLTHTEMIIGLPKETKESFITSVEEILEVGPSNLLCYMLTMNSNSTINSKDSRNKHKIKTELMNIYNGGNFKDEFEYIESIYSSKYMSRNDIKWLFKWKDFFTFSYAGLWIYFICQYLNRQYNIRRVDFISEVLNWALSNPSTVVGKCVSNWYVKNYNSGSSVSFVGPKSPHNVNWGSNFFLKQTFHWLCISENRNKFYKEIEIIIKDMRIWGSRTKDALKFQKDIMISPKYDPNIGVTFDYYFNWFDYFHFGKPLRLKRHSVHYTTKHCGSNNVLIKPNDPSSIFTIAGGDLYKQQMQNTFIHRDTESYKPTTSNVIIPREEQTNK